jgi:hypothetical protein
MRQWIKLLADRIVKAYSNTSVGHAARLNGLGSEEAQELCGLLRDRLDARWDTMVVATEPKTDREVGLDVAIERRNDKGRVGFLLFRLISPRKQLPRLLILKLMI